jgi:hypothetical protein
MEWNDVVRLRRLGKMGVGDTLWTVREEYIKERQLIIGWVLEGELE